MTLLNHMHQFHSMNCDGFSQHEFSESHDRACFRSGRLYRPHERCQQLVAGSHCVRNRNIATLKYILKMSWNPPKKNPTGAWWLSDEQRRTSDCWDARPLHFAHPVRPGSDMVKWMNQNDKDSGLSNSSRLKLRVGSGSGLNV